MSGSHHGRRSLRRKLELMFWASAVGMLGLYVAALGFGEYERRAGISQFQELRRNQPAEPAPQASVPAFDSLLAEPGAQWRERLELPPDQSEWSSARIGHFAALSVDADALADPVALLRIERVSLEVPIYPDIDERNLNRGAGLVDGTALPGSDGNVAIAAHRDGYFRVLRNVVVGDLLELDSLSDTRSYRVSDITIVDPTDVSPLDPTTQPAVTLVTCYPFYFVGNAPQRYIVRAVAEL